jgi:hypothetical protein
MASAMRGAELKRQYVLVVPFAGRGPPTAMSAIVTVFQDIPKASSTFVMF